MLYMDATDFEKLGLNRNEARVYYGLVQIGNSTAANLVKHLGVHRNIVYDNIEKLIEKGLVSYVVQEGKKVFRAQEPEMIIEFLKNKKEGIDAQMKVAESMMPEIEKLRRETSTEQEAEIFKGIKGMKKVISEILKADENWVLGITNESTNLLGETFWKNYNAKIKEKGIKERLLLNSDFEDIYVFEGNKNIQIKKLPKELDQVTEVILFDGRVAMFVYSEKPIVFLIKDKHIYDMYKKQFEFLWKVTN